MSRMERDSIRGSKLAIDQGARLRLALLDQDELPALIFRSIFWRVELLPASEPAAPMLADLETGLLGRVGWNQDLPRFLFTHPGGEVVLDDQGIDHPAHRVLGGGKVE